jgi:nitroimidazol reductase NimA-like FMN-containing flavoprotein (pyridoxamine 5'-phosphate oxidase superfamily)
LPRRVRPKLPAEWHVPNDPRKWISWNHANQKLRNEKVYWVSTSSSDGRPHAAPVWGVWKKNILYFETDPHSPKGRNLTNNPRIVFHVQDGMDTVIVEGTTEREKSPGKLRMLNADYVRKYDYKPDWSDEQRQIVFRVKPKIAHAWRAPRMHRSLVNFIF